jgi:hypothetical protein
MAYELLISVDERHSYTIGLLDVEKLRKKLGEEPNKKVS